MKTSIERRDNLVTVRLEGCLSFESAASFKDALVSLLQEAQSQLVVFDFKDLSFVGSSGMTPFIQALRDFNGKARTTPGYVNVKTEFRKLMDAFDATRSFHFLDATLAEFESNQRSLRSLDN